MMWPDWSRQFAPWRNPKACDFAIRTTWFAKPQAADSCSGRCESVTDVGGGVAADHQRDGRNCEYELKDA
jgi:hypothetical protein